MHVLKPEGFPEPSFTLLKSARFDVDAYVKEDIIDNHDMIALSGKKSM